MPALDPASVPNEALSIDLCGPADRAEQGRLFDACFKKGATPEDLAWRYDRGPHGPAISLLARPPGGEGVSGYATSPRLALVRGDEATLAPVGETGDVMTHPAWRKRGIFSGLDRSAMAEAARRGWPLCFGLPNRRSAHIFLELGWEQVGLVRPYTRPLRATRAARAAALADGRLAALALPWRALRSRARLARRAQGDLEVSGPIRAFPPETLELARAVERRFAFMVRRDPAYLTWRFLDNPSRLFDAYELRERGTLAALVVVQRPREPGGVGHVVDVLARDDAAAAGAVAAGCRALLAAGAGLARATAIDGSWWRAVLLRSGFLPPRPENHLIVILHPHAAGHPLCAAARDAAGWYFTDGDRDDATVG